MRALSGGFSCHRCGGTAPPPLPSPVDRLGASTTAHLERRFEARRRRYRRPPLGHPHRALRVSRAGVRARASRILAPARASRRYVVARRARGGAVRARARRQPRRLRRRRREAPRQRDAASERAPAVDPARDRGERGSSLSEPHDWRHAGPALLCAKIRSMLTTLVALAEDKIHKITTENRKATFGDVPGASERPGTGGRFRPGTPPQYLSRARQHRCRADGAAGHERRPAAASSDSRPGTGRRPAGDERQRSAGRGRARLRPSCGAGHERRPAAGPSVAVAGHGRRPAGDECESRRPPRDEQQRPSRDERRPTDDRPAQHGHAAAEREAPVRGQADASRTVGNLDSLPDPRAPSADAGSSGRASFR